MLSLRERKYGLEMMVSLISRQVSNFVNFLGTCGTFRNRSRLLYSKLKCLDCQLDPCNTRSMLLPKHLHRTK